MHCQLDTCLTMLLCCSSQFKVFSLPFPSFKPQVLNPRFQVEQQGHDLTYGFSKLARLM